MRKRYSTADNLFCRLRNELMNEKKKDKTDIDNFIDVQLNYFWVAFIIRDTSLLILLTVKVFFFDFKNADRRDIVTEKDKVIKG